MGFEDLSMFNDTLLAKQTWCPLHDTSSLFYKGFRAKHFSTCSVMEAKNPNPASYAWKSIIKGREVIRRGGVWRVGDGQSIRIWRDNQLPVKQKPIMISPSLHMDPDATISNFIDQESRTWREDILENSLLDFEASTTEKNPTVQNSTS